MSPAEAERLADEAGRRAGGRPITEQLERASSLRDQLEFARALGWREGESLEAFIARARPAIEHLARSAGPLHDNAVAMLAAADPKGPTMDLTNEQKKTASLLGISEADFAKALAAEASTTSSELTADERKVAAALGISEEAFAAEKRVLARNDRLIR